ncbi:ABC transporter permease [Thiomicrorhabdus sp. ZW0627]|uniref:ABC transporter permease n=1 Tax=Thiomicrorhabdus sp. ZW0627 TaxID=3039774 RepID=UPI0024363EA5|nr:FtsX-like permease family protein [Thiomicrorhabdus sp. ZW0627]MDG6774137.1 ABC transporter permease [Thiomicrorhabdus sp. ZW0627]
MKQLWLESLTASKWFLRSLKKGDWVWLILAVVIASMTVTLVKQLGETVQQSMLRKASESLGADLVIRSSRPIDAKWKSQAEGMGLKTAQSTSVVTMALSNDRFQLVNLKGVTDNYPLRGEIKQTDDLPFHALQENRVWVEPKLIGLMGLTPDSEITLGQIKTRLAGSVLNQQTLAPMGGFAPQVLIPIDTFNQTKLIGPGSRASYELYVIGDQKQIKRFSKLLSQQENPHWQILSAQSPTEDLEQSMQTAWLFLDLSALSAVLVAGMSILIASRFYLNRWQNSMALLRALGADNAKMQRLFAMQLSWIALSSSLIGVLLGYGLSVLLHPLVGHYFQPLVVADAWPAMLSGFISGMLVLWSFAWQAFQTAVQTAPMQILKSVPRTPNGIHWFISFALLLVLISLMLGLKSITWILLGLVAISVALLGVAFGLLKVMAALQTNSKGWFRIALSNLLKEPGLVKIQLVSVGMVLFVLMLMTFVRQDLLQNWQASLPANTPNTFVMNIQPDQEQQVTDILASEKLYPELVPMARGRVTAVNHKPLLASEQQEDRARRLLERESNVAILEKIPSHNEVVKAIDSSKLTLPTVSVEEGIAELFHIQPGDILTFNFAGQNFDYQVSSLRKVEWQSFQLNFFFILEPVAQRYLPISYIGNFHLNGTDETTHANPVSELTKTFAEKTPGVLLIDVRQIMKQIQDIMRQASWAVTGLYGFTLLASIGVLFTATLASQQARVQSWLLLRTLGARTNQIVKIGLTEFVLLGGLAGVLAASFAQVASLLISHFMLKTEPTLNPDLWLLSIVLGSGLLLVIGLLTQYSFLRKSPQQLKLYLNQL